MHRLLILFAKFHNIIKKKALFIIFANAVTFTIKAPASQLVVITGPSPFFPNWSPDGIPMTKGDDGVWSYTLTAKKSDEIVYKFLLDGAWADPNAPDSIDDGYGGKNGMVTVASLVGDASAVTGPKIRTQSWTGLAVQGKFLTQNALDGTKKGMDLDEVALGLMSYNKFTGEFIEGMPFYVELALSEKKLEDDKVGHITLYKKGTDGVATTTFADGMKGLVNGLLGSPLSYLSGANTLTEPDNNRGFPPYLGHLKFGWDTPYVNILTGYRYAKPTKHAAITWVTVDGEGWDAGYESWGGFNQFSNGSAIREFGDVTLDVTIAPNRTADRKGKVYGWWNYATVGWNGYTFDAQYNVMNEYDSLFSKPVEQDFILGAKGSIGPVNFALQGLAAIHGKDFTTGATDFFGYSTDVWYREKGFAGLSNMAFNAQVGYSNDLFSVKGEFRGRGYQASMLYVRENHDDEIYLLSDQLGQINSMRATVDFSIKPVDFLKVSLNAFAEMKLQDLTEDKAAKILAARESWYTTDVYPVLFDGVDMEFKPGINVGLTDFIGIDSSVDLYSTLQFTNYKNQYADNAEILNPASDSKFLFKNVGLKYSMGEINDVIGGIELYYGLDNSDAARMYNTVLGKIKLPMGFDADIGLGIRSVKGTEAGKGFNKDALNVFGASIGASKQLSVAKKPVVYAQFVYNMDPYKEQGDGQYQFNLDGYVLDDGVGDYDGAAAIRLGIIWDIK